MGLTIADQKSLLSNLRYLINKRILDLDKALQIFTLNPAAYYKLEKKGRIAPGYDADIDIFDSQLNLSSLFAMGRKMMENKKVIAESTFSIKENTRKNMVKQFQLDFGLDRKKSLIVFTYDSLNADKCVPPCVVC